MVAWPRTARLSEAHHGFVDPAAAVDVREGAHGAKGRRGAQAGVAIGRIRQGPVLPARLKKTHDRQPEGLAPFGASLEGRAST
jgi:hypothetical protein